MPTPVPVKLTEVTRAERIKNLQQEALNLGKDVVSEWLEAQAALLGACADVIECGDAVPQGIREIATREQQRLQEENLISIQLVGRLYSGQGGV